MNAKNAEGAMAEIGGRPRPQGAKDADWRPSITYPQATCGNIWNQRIHRELMNIIEHCHSISLPFCFGSESLPLHQGFIAGVRMLQQLTSSTPSRHLLGLPGGGLEFNIV